MTLHIRLGRGATLIATLLGLVNAAQFAQAETPAAPGIRLVQRGFAKMPEQRESIERLVSACQTVLKLPATPVKLPADGVLAHLAVTEVERLYDGAWEAEYETTTSVMPDPRARCALKLLRTYSARVNKSCSHRIYGATTPGRPELANMEAPASASWEVAEETYAGAGDRKCQMTESAAAVDTSALPKETTPSGASCVWMADLMAARLGRPGSGAAAKADKSLPDACVHARWYLYPYRNYQGQARRITLKNRVIFNDELVSAVPETYAQARDTFVFQEGAVIAPARFTRAALEAFVKQPVWLSMGADL